MIENCQIDDCQKRRLEAEIEALRHDLDRHMQIAAEALNAPAQATPEPSAMTERLIQAAVDYEQAGGQHAAAARRELSEARSAIEAALSTVPSTNRRPLCSLCGLEDGACICHSIRPALSSTEHS